MTRVMIAAGLLLALSASAPKSPFSPSVVASLAAGAGRALVMDAANGGPSAAPRASALSSDVAEPPPPVPSITRPPEALPGEFLIYFADGASRDRFLRQARLAGVTVLGEVPEFFVVRVAGDPEDVEGLYPSDSRIGFNYPVSLPTPVPSSGLELSQPLPDSTFPKILSENVDWGQKVTVSVLDTGITPTLSRFAGRDVRVSSALAGSDGVDDNGHGTVLASLIVGVTPAVSLVSVKVLDHNGSGNHVDLARAIVEQADAGADIINLSLGSKYSTPVLEAAVTRALDQGVIVVASVGNDSTYGVRYPASHPGVIGVTALDATGSRASYANTGPGVDLAVPVASAFIPDPATGRDLASEGTSLAAPFVSAALAYLKSQEPALEPSAAIEQIYRLASDRGAPGVDNAYGWGELDLVRLQRRHDPRFADLAITDFYLEPQRTPTSAQRVLVTVQNQGLQATNTPAFLNLEVDGEPFGAVIDPLAPGELTSVTLDVTYDRLWRLGGVPLKASLKLPEGFSDVRPANDQRMANVGYRRLSR